MITIGSSCISSVREVKGNPVVGIASSCPNKPKSLLLLTVLICSFGKHLFRSAANCSASHKETSQPVSKMSTSVDPALIVPFTCPFNLCLMHFARFHAVSLQIKSYTQYEYTYKMLLKKHYGDILTC